MSTETELQPPVRPSSVRRDSKRRGKHMTVPVVHFKRYYTFMLFRRIDQYYHAVPRANVESYVTNDTSLFVAMKM